MSTPVPSIPDTRVDLSGLVPAVPPARLNRMAQKLRLLWWYRAVADLAPDAIGADLPGLTDQEAAKAAGLYRPGVCFWHRCSDLRDERCIELHAIPQKREGDGGVDSIVCIITEAGRAVLAAHRL